MPWTDEPNGGVDPEWSGDEGSGTVVQGGTKLEQLANVSVPTGEAEDQSTIIYDAQTGLWTAQPIDAVSGVASFNGRAGIVVPAKEDYSMGLLTDVELAGLTDGQILVWSANSGDWEPEDNAASLVISVFDRIGVVTAEPGDYDADQVDFDPVPTSLSSVNVQGAIVELDVLALQNASDISTNTADIATNTSNIATNAINISTNATNISSNDTDIAQNASDISQNASDIAGKSDVGHTHDPDEAVAEPVPTGTTSGGDITVIPANPNQVNVAAGVGYIVDAYTDYTNTVVTTVSWNAVVVDLFAGLGEIRTYIYVDAAGVVRRSLTSPSPASERNTIQLGVAYRDPLTTQEPDVFNNKHRPGQDAHAFIDFVDFAGPFTTGFNPIGNPNLTIGRERGSYYDLGINYDNDITNPHVLTLPRTNPIDFYRITGDGTIESAGITTLVDPDRYDPDGAGTLAVVPQNRWVTHWLFGLVPGEVGAYQYGQVTHATLDDAKNNILTDRTNLVLPQAMTEAIGPVYALIMARGATQTNNEAEVVFINLLENTVGGSSGGDAPVTSVFGRTGDVQALLADYTAAQVSYDNTTSGLTASGVQSAIDELAAIGPGSPPVATDETPPVSAVDGDLWWDTSGVDATLFLYYDNNGSPTWVPTTPQGGGGGGGGASAEVNIVEYAVNHVMELDDLGSYVRMNVGTANTFTVAPNVDVVTPVGTQMTIRQVGLGQTTIVEGAGVTIFTPDTLVLRKQFSSITLVNVGTDAWDLMGDVELFA